MQKIDFQYKELFIETNRLKKQVDNISYFEKIKKNRIKNPFWWEEIRNIK